MVPNPMLLVQPAVAPGLQAGCHDDEEPRDIDGVCLSAPSIIDAYTTIFRLIIART
jgi:hypothetical protein